MRKTAGRLNKRLIDTWVANGERVGTKSDGANLWIRYREEDLSPSWLFRYTLGGKQRVMSLGSYRDVSLSTARKEAAKLRGKLALGIDVADERRQAKVIARSVTTAATFTVGWLADQYFIRYVADRVQNPSIVRSLIDNRIKPAIGSILLKDVRPSDIDQLIRLTASSAPSVSPKLLSRLKLIFNLGVKLEHMQFNPASVFDARDAGSGSAPRTRWLDRAELVALMRAMRAAKGWNVQNSCTIKLLLLLAVRKSELTQARVAEFDFEASVWHLPAERTKSSSGITIPLAPQAVQLLQTLISLGMGSEWLLPARKIQTRMTPHIGADTLNAALIKSVLPLMPLREKFVVHDLRRTARTHLEAMGVPPWIAERCLNHKVTGLMGVYNRHDYFDERKAALNDWALLLEELERQSFQGA